MPDFEKLDKVIHERGRLSIMSLLASRPRWAFQELKRELKMSDGNLMSHLRTLHQAGYVSIIKEVFDRQQTSYELTERGQESFRAYISTLEEIIQLGKK